jgi:hypothetical protein
MCETPDSTKNSQIERPGFSKAPPQQAKPRFIYPAFITYSQRDRRVAKRIHRLTENYRIPRELVGKPGRDGPVPERIFPVFRDRDELSSSPDLSASIHEALEHSAYLIVLCSPSSARSRWVNREIVEFKKLGRADRIHALILDGEPNAGSADQECYPPGLRFNLGADGKLDERQPAEPLAADLRREADGEENAKLKLIAGLLGIPFNALRQREVIAARRRLRKVQAIAASIALLTLLGGLAAWFAKVFYEQAIARQIPGIRVERRETTLDLSGWQETAATEVSTVKKSLAVSKNKFSVVRTHLHASKFIHIAGTTSGLVPEVRCNGCTLSPRMSAVAGRTPNEWSIEFDISNRQLDEKFDIEFSFLFWNAFQTRQQLWGGFRVLHATEVASYSIQFPTSRRPLPQTLVYFYVDSKEHVYDKELDTSLATDQAGRVEKLTWKVQYPNADRSYRVKWDWSE